ncbi:MAG: hypothetical protein JRJ03_10410, partial [Deltaproteobacteria bacterium]|nr:hypothetical protein [Deltaproteobacteria bacterium]
GRVAFNHPVYERREELNTSAIGLDARMRLGKWSGKDTFIALWEEVLQKLPEQLDRRFAALARWLYAHRDESPEALLSEMNALGQPDQALIGAIGGEPEYGSRSKDNFFAKEGARGTQAVREALEYLKKEAPKDWLRGITTLADCISARAGEKKGGAQ